MKNLSFSILYHKYTRKRHRVLWHLIFGLHWLADILKKKTQQSSHNCDYIIAPRHDEYRHVKNKKTNQ